MARYEGMIDLRRALVNPKNLRMGKNLKRRIDSL